jgi:hypothetical protein
MAAMHITTTKYYSVGDATKDAIVPTTTKKTTPTIATHDGNPESVTKHTPSTTAVSATPATTTATAMTSTTTNEDEEVRSKNSIFVAGLMFTDKDHYLDALQAMADTWLTLIPQQRVFAVGPASAAGKRRNMPRLVPTPCPDRELWCKRLLHIVEAYKMLKSGTPFDWLLSGNEDWYVNLPAMRKAFEGKSPDDPAVFTSLGCSQAWEYHESSKNNTVPKPGNWPVNQQCKTLSIRGGGCFGSGVVFSRRAIEIMMEGGEESLFNLTKSLDFNWDGHPQDDPVLSCLVYAFDDKIRFELHPWQSSGGYQFLKDGATEQQRTIATLHAVRQRDMNMTTAEMLYAIHSRMALLHENNTDSVRRILHPLPP